MAVTPADPIFAPLPSRPYDPAQGPPSWIAGGHGIGGVATAATYDEFLSQQARYVAFLQQGGAYTAVRPVGAQEAAYNVVTNVRTLAPVTPHARGAAAPTVYTDPLGPPGPPATGAAVAAATADATGLLPECPPGYARIQQRNGRSTCFQVQGVSGRGGSPSSVPGPLQTFVPGGTMATQVWNPMVNQLTAEQIGGLGAVAGAGCDFIRNESARALCRAGVAVGTGLLVGGGGNQTAGRGETLSPVGGGSLAPCPEGYRPRAGGGCEPASGISRVAGWMTPGIDVGRPDVVWQGVRGQLMGGVAPAEKSTLRRLCPRRYVLGLDNVCYPKPMLPRALRKWTPDPRPLLSAMDAKIMQRAKAVGKRVNRAASKYAPKRKACSCGPKRRGK